MPPPPRTARAARTARAGLLGLAGTAVLVIAAVATPTASAVPPAGGGCQSPWQENTTLVNPADPGFFARTDKNGDGVICVKDFTGPDPDPAVGFLAIDNMVRRGR